MSIRDIFSLLGWLHKHPESSFDESSNRQRYSILNQMLTGSLHFWKEQIDWTHGGFFGLADLQGRPVPNASKDLIQQVRHLWTFSQVYRFFDNSESIAKICRHQWEFIRDRFHDTESRSFFHEVSCCGKPIRQEVHHYPLSFVLFGLANFAIAFSSEEVASEALTMANDLFKKLIEESWDSENGFDETVYGNRWCVDDKEINTQMHLLEGVAELYEANHVHSTDLEKQVREVLKRQLELIYDKAIVERGGAFFCSRGYDKDWTLRDDSEVDHGHDIEVVYLVWHAALRLGLENTSQVSQPITALARTTAEQAFDRRFGKWYYSGAPLTGKVVHRVSNYWTNFEALNGLMVAYRLTGETEFLTMFDRVLRWLKRKQCNPQVGDWYYNVNWLGRPVGKGVFGEDCNWMTFPWKSSYHSSRALISSMLWLDSELPNRQLLRPAPSFGPSEPSKP